MIWKFLQWIKTSNNISAKILFKILLFVYEKIIWGQFIHALYDNFRFFRYSAWVKLNTIEKYDSYLIKEYHKIEKWLTYQNFRPYFWKKVIAHIFIIINNWWDKFWLTSWAKIALNTIQNYLIFHKKNSFNNDIFLEDTERLLNQVLDKYSYVIDKLFWGTLDIQKTQILETLPKKPKDFFYSRYSIRDFSDKPVKISEIEDAIEIAQKTPSVCNRQSTKVYLLSEKEDIQNALKYQNWNAWFNHKINKLLIITSDLSSFHIGTERYQNWVDWGMFSMSVVYAIHSLWIWSCCLNWSAYFYNDMKIRKVVPIKNNESIIMMIAVWNIPEKLKVAQSPRKNLKEVLIKV